MRLVRKMLNNAGYEVIEAVDGMSAMNTAMSARPDLILMDVNLPDIDGLEVTGRLREAVEMRNVPIIALTANAMHGDRERCLAAGCSGYIPKPITKSELLNTIAHFLVRINTVNA